MNIYEQNMIVSQYLEFHYGDEYFNVPNFPVQCIDHCMLYLKNGLTHRALDLACAVGRSTFELAKYFDHVDGVDFSARFIQEAKQFQQLGQIQFELVSEGELVDSKTIKLSDLAYQDLIDKIDFKQGDACQLDPVLKDYDLIFCGNLIDRLYDPRLFLQGIRQRLVPGGMLVMTSPYTWKEEFTEKEKWLGGFEINGKKQTTLEGLKAQLLAEFELIQVIDLPFVIRETTRKYQHSIAQMSVWQRH